MPIDSLKVKALVVLEEACGRVGRERIYPEPGLRLALAFLFATSEGDRGHFDEFWGAVVDQPVGQNPQALIARQAVVPHLNGICGAVGIERTTGIISLSSHALKHRKGTAL